MMTMMLCNCNIPLLYVVANELVPLQCQCLLGNNYHLKSLLVSPLSLLYVHVQISHRSILANSKKLK